MSYNDSPNNPRQETQIASPAKVDVDAGCSLVIIVQFLNFIFDEGVIELPLTHYFVV